MRAIDADIWILTETNSCVSPGGSYKAVATSPISSLGRYTAGENRTTIWSRLPMGGGTIETCDPETAVCAEIQLAGSLFLIYGTIIPYHAAGTRYPYRFLGENQQGRNSWELHYESISRHATDWLRLRKQFPGHHLVVRRLQPEPGTQVLVRDSKGTRGFGHCAGGGRSFLCDRRGNPTRGPKRRPQPRG